MADESLTQQILNEAGGNASDSPTDDGGAQADGGTQSGDATTGDDTGQTGQEDAGPGTAEGGEKEGGEEGGKEKPPPYDQDPKWKAARAAEKRANEILEEHGLESLDELAERLEAGESLREILGGDPEAAKQIVADAQEMTRTREFWAQKEAEKREADETPEETVDRLKREKRDLEVRLQQDAEDRAAIEESNRVIKEFDSTVTRTVNEDSDLSDTEKTIMTLALGVGNEAATVDPTDRKAVRQTIPAVINKIKGLLKERDQAVIDKYVAGKSDITPIKPTDTGTGSPSVKTEREPLEPDTSLDDANAAAKARIAEIFRKAEAA